MSLTDSVSGLAIRLSLTGCLSVCFAGDGPSNYDDYEDLAGPDIGAILGKVGWRYSGAVTRVDALAGTGPAQLPVASAWATPIVMPTGERGINISYGVGTSHRGRGLASLLAYVAVGECSVLQALRFRPEPTFVNVQARSCNDRSQRVAQALGIARDPAAAFLARLPDGRGLTFVGFREHLTAFLDRGLEPTLHRLGTYVPGLLVSAAAAAGSHDEFRPRPRSRGRRSRFDAFGLDDMPSNSETPPGPR
jgi:hypothetical protein